jgi:hypothetical protein
MSKASAYGDEIWQVDSLSQGADRMFISLKSLKGFSSGATNHKIIRGGSRRLPLNKYTRQIFQNTPLA